MICIFLISLGLIAGGVLKFQAFPELDGDVIEARLLLAPGMSLAGIVVNDSILLVLFLKMERAQGTNVLQSAAQASRQRFRAIVLTSLTTIAGLLPLLTERSLQAQILIPLATSVAFELMSSTVLVLLVIPSLYAILDDIGLTAASDRDYGSPRRIGPDCPAVASLTPPWGAAIETALWSSHN